MLIVLGFVIPGSRDSARALLTPMIRAWLILSMTAGLLKLSLDDALASVDGARKLLLSALCWVETDAAEPLTGLMRESEPSSGPKLSSLREEPGRAYFTSELSKEFIVPERTVV